MQDFEKLGVFYLGRAYDVEARTQGSDPLLYDARDLTTHGVIVGMTGSGKTGLGVALLEEAAIDAVPSLVIDPKGDLTNLMLAFPGLTPAEFRPYVDPDEARRQGVSVEELAERTAQVWKKGLGEWGQDGARVQRFRDAAEVAIYTPGSSAGLPLSVLRSFEAPPPSLAADSEALRDRVSGITSGLLALVDVDADPLRSREHILLSSILSKAFTAGEKLDLAGIIRQVQKPPFDRVGVLDLESFFPTADRFALAMALNNLLASPGFAAWTEGEPLDIGRLLHTAEGKPRVSVLSIAHLSESERMFFVSVLLNEVVGWMRTQQGTSSLRAILYMDEIAGYFPPVAMPPSKRPMLTLLKQARAFGLGVVVATQNPVDLDYKGLSNCGTWFIGRLQTERDKARLLDGLEGAAAGSGRGFDRARIDRILAGLGSRVFLMNNVHDDAPVTFQSRWALSYLRGPLTRDQIRGLMDGRRGLASGKVVPAAATSTPSAGATVTPTGTATATDPASGGQQRVLLGAGVTEFFLGVKGDESGIVYRGAVLGSARLHFVHAKAGLDVWETHVLLAPVGEDGEMDWGQATVLADEAPDLGKEPVSGAEFAELAGAATRKASYDGWRKTFTSHLYQEKAISVLRCAALKAISNPGESERDFRMRLGQTAKERRDAEVDTLRRRYAPKVAALEEKKRRAEEKVARERADFQRQSVDTALSVGSTILGALFGRKVATAGNLGRARTAARSATRSVKERGDIASAEGNVEAIDRQIGELSATIDGELKAIEGNVDPATLALEAIEVKPRKGDITVGAVALCWCPWRRGARGMVEPAF